MAPDEGSRPSRARDDEQRLWPERRGSWRFWLLQAAVFLMVGASAWLRDDRWFLALGVVGTLVAGGVATRAYRASRMS
jgi:hypothetical protein